MNAAAIIALMSVIQTLLRTIADLTGKDILVKEDFATKTPEEILAENGIDVTTL